jgi:hypothetical protein
LKIIFYWRKKLALFSSLDSEGCPEKNIFFNIFIFQLLYVLILISGIFEMNKKSLYKINLTKTYSTKGLKLRENYCEARMIF